MAKNIVTNNGKKGGWLVGKRHYDKTGKPLGGIKAVVTDAGDKPVELEGGEVIINREASKKHWKELSRINQSAGNGVPIEPPSGSFDEDPSEDYEQGGKIEFNANHIPNKWILNYAIKIKEEHKDVWDLGGNIFGNQAFINLKRVAERGYWLDSEEWMYKKWRSYVARHQRDYRIEGVIAMLKWVDKVEKGWQYMKNLIEEEIKKREAKKSRKMSKGAMINSKSKYSVEFKKRKSLGNYDRELEISESNKTLNQIYNMLYNIEYKDNGWYIKGSILIKDDNGVQVRIPEFTSDLNLQKMFDEKNSSKMSDGGAISIYNDKSRFPNDGETVLIKDVDYDMMSFFDRTNKELLITLKNGKKVKASVGQFNDDIIFHGDFPKKIEYSNYRLQLKEFDNIEIVKQMYKGGNTDSVLSKLDKLPKGSMFEDAKKIDTVFKKSNHSWSEVIETFETNDDNAETKYVNIKDIKITQPNIQSHKIEGMLNDFDKLPIINAVKFSDGYTIYDGHHRLITAWLLGKNKIKLNVVNAENNKMSDGGRTPAPLKDRIKGSKFNEKGTASTSSKAESIKFDDKTISSIQSLIDDHNEKYPSKKITLAVAKAVVRRGMGAYSSSHRTTITGGKPNSRTAWGLARLKAFIHKAQTGKSKSGKYSQDNDLFEELNISVQKMNKGGELEKGIKAEHEHSKTIAKFKRKGVSDLEIERAIAEDHLKEDPHYYTKLAKMEAKKFAKGGSTLDINGQTLTIGETGAYGKKKESITITGFTPKLVKFQTADGKQKGIYFDDFIKNYSSNMPKTSIQTTQSTQTTKSTTTPLNDYRVKTEKELIDEFGLNWRIETGWTTSSKMDWMFGKRLDEITVKGNEKEDFTSVLAKSSINIDPYKDPHTTAWTLYSKQWVYDPVSSQQNTIIEKFKLIDTISPNYLKNKKIRFSSESESKAFQEYIFKLGASWYGKTDPMFLSKPYMLIDDNLNLAITEDLIRFKQAKNKEIYFNDYFELEKVKSQSTNQINNQTIHELENYRIKTKEEFKDEYGLTWRQIVGWNLQKYMDYLFGNKLTDIVTPDLYDNVLNSIKNDNNFESNYYPTPVDDKEWIINPKMYKLDPKLLKENVEKNINKELSETTPTEQVDLKKQQDVKSEKELLVEQYNDVLFLISVTPTTDIDNMLSLKAKAKELKDAIDLIDLEIRKKVQTEFTLLDELFDASTIKPQERYKFTPYVDGFAPDGQPTQLPKNIYDWTMTEEFQNWFGNFTLAYNYRNSTYENVPCSVVVNKNYEPLIVYHGTGSEFSFFKFDSFPAMYFAENESYSNWFAELKGQQNGTNGYVYPFVLNIRTPLDLTLFETNKITPTEFIDWMYLQTGLDESELKINKALLNPNVKNQAWVYLRNSPEMLKVLRDKNVCDGIIYYEDNPSVDVSSPAYITKAYIVFNANSAKIANNERHIQTIPAMRSFFLKRGGKL